MKITGRVFIVTGGASGLGLGVVQLLAGNGGKVMIADLNNDGQRIASEMGPSVAFMKTNVADEANVQQMIDSTVSQFGGLHGVVNCAGVGLPKRVLSRGRVHDLDSFNFVIKVNLVGSFNVLRLAAAAMAKQQPEDEKDGERGVIINTASVAAFDGQIGQAAYSASKAAIVGMTLPIARDLADKGIRINAIAPGIFWTPMMAGLPEKARKSLAKQVPFPSRFGTPEEFAELCKSIIENKYLNGTVIRLDGSLRMAAM